VEGGRLEIHGAAQIARGSLEVPLAVREETPGRVCARDLAIAERILRQPVEYLPEAHLRGVGDLGERSLRLGTRGGPLRLAHLTVGKGPPGMHRGLPVAPSVRKEVGLELTVSLGGPP